MDIKRIRQQNRQKVIRHRKNFLPTVIISTILWIVVVCYIYFVDPDDLGAIPGFLILLFTNLLFTFSMLFLNTRRGLLVSITITTFTLLKILGVGNILNLVLLVAIAICLDIYFKRQV